MIPRFAFLPACCAAMLTFFAILPLASARAGETAPPLLHAMFRDHAVLQRDQPLRIWGQARAGDEVRVEFAGRHARTRADAQGNWQVQLAALPAGGPYALSAASGALKQRVADVLVGDVWLCSGQSNMELQVHRTLDSRAEMAGADNDRIRLLSVPQDARVVAQTDFVDPPQWEAVNPQSVREFSAACYYFARELQKTVDVPMGLIDASWGGSRIQAWISSEALRRSGRYDGELDVLEAYARDPMAALGDWGALWQQWWSSRPGIQANDKPWSEDPAQGNDWQKAPTPLGAWERWGVPELADFNGMLWYRTTVILTAAQAAQDARLALGPADEIDMTWVNGRAVGSTYGAGDGRDYPLPAGLLHEGRNVIVVNVLDTYRDGGLAGPASLHFLRLGDGSQVPLDGDWRWRRVGPSRGTPPRAPWQSAAGLATLYNGMIAPLGQYGLRGLLWYQGESNTFEADRYADLLRDLRDDWRSRFGRDLPLLVIQLANYGAVASTPGESDWASLREAQRQVAMEPHSGLAVAIDIGDRYDIHPANKQELGRRLARLARHVVYAEQSLPASGPVPHAITRHGDAIRINFADISDRLVAYGAEAPIGFELCGASAGSCRYANATLKDGSVELQGPTAASATRVRYCWADSPICTLYDGSGLPAGPFELPIAPTQPGQDK